MTKLIPDLCKCKRRHLSILMHALLVLYLVFFAYEARATPSSANDRWYYYADSATVIIFVHGIFTDSKKCWTADNGAYWPELVRKDTRFGSPGIYLGGYYAEAGSGIYRIPDAARELLSYLQVPDADGHAPALSKPNIVFVAHSTGGLVVRYLVEKNRELFQQKHVGLVLLASPSRGSAWSNRLSWLRELYGNKMAGELAQDNDFVLDLDGRFADLVGQRRLPGLVGIDAFENHFIVPGLFANATHVVSAQDSTSYFGSPRIIPNTDHFSIAKPSSSEAAPHQVLWEFYDRVFIPSLNVSIHSLAFGSDAIGAQAEKTACLEKQDNSACSRYSQMEFKGCANEDRICRLRAVCWEDKGRALILNKTQCLPTSNEQSCTFMKSLNADLLAKDCDAEMFTQPLQVH